MNIYCKSKKNDSSLFTFALPGSITALVLFGGYEFFWNKKLNIKKIENSEKLLGKIKPLIFSKFEIETYENCRFIEGFLESLNELDSKKILNFQQTIDHQTLQEAALFFNNGVNEKNLLEKMKEFYKNQINKFKSKKLVYEAIPIILKIMHEQKNEKLLETTSNLVHALSLYNEEQKYLLNEEITKSTKIKEELNEHNIFEIKYEGLLYYLKHIVLSEKF